MANSHVSASVRAAGVLDRTHRGISSRWIVLERGARPLGLNDHPRDTRRLTALLRAANDEQAPTLGIYVLACILRTQDGREQTQLGMERTIQIVR